MPLRLTPSLHARLTASDRALVGGWSCAGSAVMAEIMAGSGLDWVLVDMEHAPNDLSSVLAQLHAVSGLPATPVVRVPEGTAVNLKQVLDLGAQNVMVPMVDTPEQAAEVASFVAYPPHGVRGIGSALARSARWNRVPDYLHEARSTITLVVQIESAEAVANAGAIAATPGIDAVFVGPADLAASMGHLGRQDHPEVVAAVDAVIAAAHAEGVPVGVNAFAPALARGYVEAGVDFVAVGADVALVARASEELAADFLD